MGLASDDTESKASAVTHEFAPKLDPHGFPLRPQPSDDPLGQTSTIAMQVLANGAQIPCIGAPRGSSSCCFRCPSLDFWGLSRRGRW